MIKVFSGNSSKKFAEQVCKHLKLPLSEMIIKKFSDSETYVKSKVKVRGDDVFIIQSTSRPVNENLMELLIMIDAMKRSSVKRINCVSHTAAIRTTLNSMIFIIAFLSMNS